MKINFSLVKSGRLQDKELALPDSKFGYNWFFFRPRLNWNGGYCKDTVTDLSVSCIYYNFGVLIWLK